MQVLGGWQGLIGAWRWATLGPAWTYSKPRGSKQGQACLFPYTRVHWGRWVGLCPQVKPILSPHLKFLKQGSLVLPPKGPSGLPFLWLPLSFICGHCGWTGRATRSKGIPQGINENSNPDSSGGISCNWQGLMRSKISFGISLVQPMCSWEGWVGGNDSTPGVTQ